MYLFIILTILCLVVTFVLFIFRGFDFMPFFVFLIMCSFLVVLFVSLIVWHSSEHLEYESDSYDIVSLKDNISTESDFILGIGGSDTDLKYYFYYQTENGLEYKSINAEDVTIVYDTVPRFVTYSEKYLNDNLSNWFLPFGKRKNILYIPQQSVFQNIILDLQ